MQAGTPALRPTDGLLRHPPDESALRERDHIHDWTVAGAVRSGAFVHTDFNDRVPRYNLLTGRHHPHEQARTDLEIFDYPGGYTKHAEGDLAGKAVGGNRISPDACGRSWSGGLL